MSHKDPAVVDEMLKMINKKFGKLVVSRGNEYDLLGMKIKIDRENKKVIIDMCEQINEALEMFEEGVDDRVVTPANKNLFTTFDSVCKELDE